MNSIGINWIVARRGCSISITLQLHSILSTERMFGNVLLSSTDTSIKAVQISLFHSELLSTPRLRTSTLYLSPRPTCLEQDLTELDSGLERL